MKIVDDESGEAIYISKCYYKFFDDPVYAAGFKMMEDQPTFGDGEECVLGKVQIVR